MNVKRFVHCPLCGEKELTSEQYNHQMDRGWSRWYCPTCGNTAAWGGEFYPCLDKTCTGWAEVKCNVCGRDQYELLCLMEEGEV